MIYEFPGLYFSVKKMNLFIVKKIICVLLHSFLEN
jgi:hypothetical protein